MANESSSLLKKTTNDSCENLEPAKPGVEVNADKSAGENSFNDIDQDLEKSYEIPEIGESNLIPTGPDGNLKKKEDTKESSQITVETSDRPHESIIQKAKKISIKEDFFKKKGLKTKNESPDQKSKSNSFSLKFRSKSKDDLKDEEKAEVNTSEGPDKTGISEKFNDLMEILKNLIKSDKPESAEAVLHHSKYPDNPEITPGLIPESYEILESYWLYPPHSFVIIVSDEEKNLQYMVFEPEITEQEHIILEETDAQLRSVVLYDSKAQNERVNLDSELVYKIVKNLDQNIADDRIDIISYYLYRNFKGYGKLDPLMHDEGIEDITCNGPDIPVFIFHRKYSNLPVNIVFENKELNRFVLKIAQKADKQLSLTAPLVDAALPEGARAQITYTDVVSSKGSSFTIRKFKSDPMTPIDLIDYGTYDAEILAFIWLCVENRKSAIVVGGTASGKTSMMNAFSLFIPHLAKIVSIEDTREIQMPHKNWLPMMTRESASQSGKGNVDMFSLLKTALRQRPEYIIVGEVRGAEAQTLFQAMNTGHTTYSTLHAGGVEQAINRLTTNPINVPVAMFGALDLMIIQQLQYIGGRMVRRCITIDEIVAEKNDITYNILYKWNPVKDVFRKIYKESKIITDIAYSHGWTVDETLNQIEIRKEILEGLLKNGIRNSDEITAVFVEFAKSGRYDFEG
ncbi:type II secretion system protein E [Methanolacinia petrolearia DSM 11571]|uniref:Type II secretion system protein E n=2 Tax=Methanolacinia TaxID=230355 RepID=E1RI08_METP4|nr:type II secretion system protein E [Methanolacinia petrolearia DSM 11571]